jgi:hypothetical protein
MSVAATKPQIVNQNISYEVIGHFTKGDLTAIVTPFYNVFNTSGNVSATMPEEFAPQTGVTLYKTYYNVFVTALGRVEQATIEKFAASSEYIADFPITMSHDAFIAKLYLNAFNRAPDAEGRAGWVSALDHGMDRSEVILSFATSDEMIALIGSLPATAPG